MSCHICGASPEPDRSCVTNKGELLCSKCFAEFVRDRSKHAHKKSKGGAK